MEENILEQYVLKVLNENGFDKLDEQAKKQYLPQFVVQAEQRLGAALLPLLNEESANAFVELTKKQDAKPDEWWGFWKKHVPDFEKLVEKTLQEFAVETKDAFSL